MPLLFADKTKEYTHTFRTKIPPRPPPPVPSGHIVGRCDGTETIIVADLPVLAYICAETPALLLRSGHKNEKEAFGFDLQAAQSRFYGKGSCSRPLCILSANCH